MATVGTDITIQRYILLRARCRPFGEIPCYLRKPWLYECVTQNVLISLKHQLRRLPGSPGRGASG